MVFEHSKSYVTDFNGFYTYVLCALRKARRIAKIIVNLICIQKAQLLEEWTNRAYIIMFAL